jgi:hypothetical protein
VIPGAPFRVDLTPDRRGAIRWRVWDSKGALLGRACVGFADEQQAWVNAAKMSCRVVAETLGRKTEPMTFELREHKDSADLPCEAFVWWIEDHTTGEVVARSHKLFASRSDAWINARQVAAALILAALALQSEQHEH